MSPVPASLLWPQRLLAIVLVALVSFLGGIDPPLARATPVLHALPAALDPSLADENAALRDPALRDPLLRLERVLAEVHVEAIGGSPRATLRAGADAGRIAQEVAALQPEIEGFLASVRSQFDLDRAWLLDEGMGDLLARVDAMEALAIARHAEVSAAIDEVARAAQAAGDASAALAKLKELLATYAAPKAAPLSAEQMRAESDLLRAGEPFVDAAAFRRWIESRASPDEQPLVEPSGLPGTPDLAETPEIRFTQAIQQRAAALGGDPLRIYTWVRNNIRFVPGYGAAQSADFTLVNGQGTPFDIASLLIALLRASGVPARYATGRIAVPAAQAKGWLEPVAGAADAAEMLQMSGTPAVARVVGGVVEDVQLEHVWVEAWLDYEPSRGAVHREGDSWIAMDASFKQHVVDIDIPPPPETHPIGARINAIWNEREVLPNGAFTRFDLDRAADELFAFGDELVPDGVEEAHPLPEAQIIAQTPSTFPSALPYDVLVRSAAFAEVPNALRYRVEIEVLRGGGNQIFPIGFSPVFSRTVPLARIDHGGINVEYAPANAAAETLLNNLYVQAPRELSPYAIDVAPVIRFGEVIENILTPVRMGETEQWRITVRDPLGLRPSQARPFQWTAGTQANITIDAFGLSAGAMQDLLPDSLAGQTVNSRTFLRSAGLSYWYGHDYYASAAGAAFGGRILRLPSVGAFYKPMTVSYFFGVPRRGSYLGYTTDVLTTVGPVAPTPAKLRNMMLSMGSWGSFLEGLIWDVHGGQTPGTASSSTSVLLAANEAGIPIFVIDQDNVDQILPQLQLNQDSLTEIRNAANAGMIVMTPQREVSIAGQPAVAGYIIRDPVTGAGLSRIDGALNGSIVVGCLAEAISLDNLLNYLMWRMIERILAPFIARGVIAAAAIFALGPIGVVAATLISVTTLICAAMTLLQFLIDMSINGVEQAVCNLLGSCMGRKARRRLMGRGRPIMPELGMKFLGETDYEGEGPFPLRFERTYLSGGIARGALSAGWSAPYFTDYRESRNSGESFVRVEVLPPGSPFNPPQLDIMVGVPHAMLFMREDGGYFQFNRTPNGYSTVLNQPERIDSTGEGEARRWTYLADDDVVETYDHEGRMLSLRDRNGVTQTMTYNAQGQLLRVDHSLGRSLEFTYHPSGQLATMTAPGNQVTRYEYESLNLVRVVHPDATTRQYHYEDERFPGKLTGVTDQRGIRTVWVEYDYRGRAIETRGPDGADRYRFAYREGGFTETDPLGTVRDYRLTRVEDIWRATLVGQPCSTCGTEAATTVFDANGYPASETDFEGTQTRYTYDARGLLRSQTDAFGTPLARTTTWEFHPDFRVMTRMVEPAASGGSRITEQTLDDSGNVLERRVTVGAQTRTWTYTWNAAGQMLSEDGPRTDVSDVVQYTYDAQGNLATMTDALGFVTQYTEYDAHGKLLEMIDPNGLVEEYAYDALDRLSRVRRGPQGSVQRETISYDYDDAGNLERLQLADGSTLDYDYDDAERLVVTRDALGNRLTFTYDALGQTVGEQVFDPSNTLAMTQTKAYDALGRLERVTGSRPEDVTAFAYDGNGNQISLHVPSHASPTTTDYDVLDRIERVVDPTGAEIEYRYDAQDNLRRVIDPRLLETAYGYNGFDEMVSLDSPDAGSTSYGYDPAANLVNQTDARGIASTRSYDAGNRIDSVTYPDELIDYHYDEPGGGEGARGRLTRAVTSARNGSGIDGTGLSIEYDRFGRVLRRSQTVGQAGALATSHTYDPQGRVDSTILPSGVVVRYAYGADGRVLRISVNGVEIVRDIQYFPFGEPRSWAYGTGTASYDRSFDLDGRIREHSLGSGDRTLTYDFAGRVATQEDDVAAQSDWGYTYDDADRLVTAVNSATLGPTSSLRFEWLFDLSGNRESESMQIGAATPAVVDYGIGGTSNRLLTLTGSASLTRSYDASGNTLAWRAERGDFAGSELTATYSGRSRMVRVDRAGPARVARYAYSAFGERIGKWTGADAALPAAPPTRQFVFDEAGHLLGEYTGAGALLAEHVWLEDTPIAVLKPAGTGAAGQTIPGGAGQPAVEAFFVHSDHLDTPRAVENGSAQLVWRWESTPYGETAAQEQPTAGLAPFEYSIRFPGQIYDRETGQHYNRFRDFDSETGRYLQADPIGVDGGPTLYTYSGSNPVVLSDPSGLVHRNCRDYKGDCHVYEIWGPRGKLYKIGESCRGTNQAGLSRRCEEQARRLTRDSGKTHRCKIVYKANSKAKVRDEETRRIKKARRCGCKLPGNKGNR